MSIVRYHHRPRRIHHHHLTRSKRLHHGGFLGALPLVHSILSTIRPVTLIDAGLKAIGKRDQVRGALNKNFIGRALVGAANAAKKYLGYGRKRAGSRRKVGHPRKVERPRGSGSKSRSRRK
jgi:hypothetical protein